MHERDAIVMPSVVLPAGSCRLPAAIEYDSRQSAVAAATGRYGLASAQASKVEAIRAQVEGSMNDLPRTARAYLIAVWLIAAIAIAATLVSVRSALLDQAPLLALVLLLFIIADYFEVETEIDNGNRVSMTVVDAPTIFLLAVAGPAGIVVVVLGTAIVDVLGKRSWYKVLFNL